MITGAAQDIVLERIEPDSGQLTCPNQRVMYQCQLLISAFALLWTLPNGDGSLEFDINSNVDDVLISGDGVYAATPTSKTDDPDSSRFFFTSTLLIMETVNDTSLTCSGAATPAVEETTDIILSGGY